MSAQDFRIRLNLDNAPDIATELGNMCAAWSALEFRLFVLFAIIGGMPSAIARATFYSHHTTRNRTQLIMRVAGMVFRDSHRRNVSLNCSMICLDESTKPPASEMHISMILGRL